MTNHHFVERIVIFLQAICLTILVFILTVSLRKTPSDVWREVRRLEADVHLLLEAAEVKRK